jgi:hypothetical protein
MPGSSVLERLTSAIADLRLSLKDLSSSSAYNAQFSQFQDITIDAFDNLNLLSSLFFPPSCTTLPGKSTELPALPAAMAAPDIPLVPPPPV